MWTERIAYFFRETWRNFRTNPVVSSVSTGIISLSLLIFGLFLLIYINFQGLSEKWSRKVRVDAYLVDGVSAGQLADIRSKILATPGVEKIDYISAMKALEDFRKMLGAENSLLKELDTNPLPASFMVYPDKEHRSPEAVAAIAGAIGKLEGVDDVRYGAEWVDKFDSMIRLMQLLGIIIGGILFLSSLLIISNTIRLTIYARREEIEIMRLVGADEKFIRIPFFLEGLLEGFTAGAMALGLLWALYRSVLVNIQLPMGGMGAGVGFSFLPTAASWALVAGGTVIGMMGSAFALSRSEDQAEK